MKNKRKTLLCLFGALMIVPIIQAQQKLIVQKFNQVEDAFLLTNVNKITFEQKNMLIDSKNKSAYMYETSDLIKLFFEEDPVKKEEITPKNDSPELISVYPNPVDNLIHLQSESFKKGVHAIYVMNTLGKLMMVKKEWISEGLNNLSFDVSKLSSGLYICIIKSKNQTQTVKFNKY